MSKLNDQTIAVALEAITTASKLAASNSAIAERVAASAADTAARMVQNSADTATELATHQAVCDEQNKHVRNEIHAVIHRVNRLEKLVIGLNGSALAGMMIIIWYFLQNIKWQH